jgi:hypothetical protein
MVLLALMLTGVLVAYRRTMNAISRHTIRQHAAAIAQTRMETLLAIRQEPNSADLSGRDELQGEYTWEYTLSREVIGSAVPAKDLSNTVIKAVVTVRHEGDLYEDDPVEVELTRYFGSLKPIPGQPVAVPLTPEIEEPDWYLALKEKLGREPTAEEAMAELLRNEDLPPDLAELLQDTNSYQTEPEDDWDDDEEPEDTDVPGLGDILKLTS